MPDTVSGQVETVRSLCTKSKVLEGFSIEGGIERDGKYLVIKDEIRKQAEVGVKKWLKKLRLASLQIKDLTR
jgi:hypothetical protein